MDQQAPAPVLRQAAMLIAIGIGFFCVGIVDVFISKPLWLIIFLLVVGAGFMMMGAVVLLCHKRKR